MRLAVPPGIPSEERQIERDRIRKIVFFIVGTPNI
jgi:hypothetical protein